MNVHNPWKSSLSDLEFLDIKTISVNGFRSMPVHYNGGQLGLHTCVMKTPFGLKKYDDSSRGTSKYSLDISSTDCKKTEKLFECINNIEEQVIQHCIQDPIVYFKRKNITYEEAKELWSSSLKYNENYPTLLKTKVQLTGSKQNMTKVFDYDKKSVSADKVPNVLMKNVHMIGIVKCGGVWFFGNRFGITWNFDQLLLKKEVTEISLPDDAHSLQSFAFDDDAAEASCLFTD